MGFRKWALRGLGYLLFLWASLDLITLRLVSPDMCLAGTAYLAVGILLRIKRGHQALWWPVLLGFVLGIGYLTKAVMFPLAFAFLAASLAGGDDLRRKVGVMLTALLCFLVVSLPFVAAISRAKGYVTFGEAGRINYIWFVNGTLQGYGPVHAPRELVKGLGVYGFPKSVPRHDPSYWMEGVKLRFNLKQQLRRLIWSAKDLGAVLLRSPFGASVLTCILILLWQSGSSLRKLTRDVLGYLPLVGLGLLGLLVYALVLVESRYVAPFAVMTGVGLFAMARLPDARHSGLPGGVLALALVLAATLEPLLLARTAVSVVKREVPQHEEWQTARQLLRLGVRQGDEVGLIGRRSFWARIARLRVTAGMRPRDWLEEGRRRYEDYVSRFWEADPGTRRRVLEAMANWGVTAVVAEHVPPLADTSGWHRLGNTDRYVWLVKQGGRE